MQLALLGHGRPARLSTDAPTSRTWLPGAAWVDRCVGWVEGQAALMQELEASLEWGTHQRWMYDRRVLVPRLMAADPVSVPDIVVQMRDELSARYGYAFSASFALYRDGNDSVAWHRDRGLCELHETVTAIVSLGGPRTFCMRPHRGQETEGTQGLPVSWSVGWGDLIVMGGAAQRLWEHAVPKQRHAEPRMAIMFRPTRRPISGA